MKDKDKGLPATGPTDLSHWATHDKDKGLPSKTEGRNSENFDHYISFTSPSPTGPTDLSQENWERERNAGAQKKDFKNYPIVFSHHDLYYLLRLLEDRALSSESYAEVRQCVLFAEIIRAQAREQGF